jgi:hypothetical protein
MHDLQCVDLIVSVRFGLAVDYARENKYYGPSGDTCSQLAIIYDPLFARGRPSYLRFLPTDPPSYTVPVHVAFARLYFWGV